MLHEGFRVGSTAVTKIGVGESPNGDPGRKTGQLDSVRGGVVHGPNFPSFDPTLGLVAPRPSHLLPSPPCASCRWACGGQVCAETRLPVPRTMQRARQVNGNVEAGEPLVTRTRR